MSEETDFAKKEAAGAPGEEFPELRGRQTPPAPRESREGGTKGEIFKSDVPFPPRGDVPEELADYPRGEGIQEAPDEEVHPPGLSITRTPGLVRAAMDRDLADIQSEYPWVKSLEELPPVYRALRFNPYVPMGARRARRAAMGAAGSKPPSTGSMEASLGPGRDYYTSRELDRLSPEDLKSPAVYEKAMKSLLKL